MFRSSSISVTQLLINVADNKFDRSDYGENEVRILSAFFASKDPIEAGYLAFNIKKAFNFL